MQGFGDAIGPSAAPITTEGQTSHEDDQHGGSGVGGSSQEAGEHTHPDGLIHETAAAGEKESKENDGLNTGNGHWAMIHDVSPSLSHKKDLARGLRQKSGCHGTTVVVVNVDQHCPICRPIANAAGEYVLLLPVSVSHEA